jgi:hypothetical protein
MINCFICWFYTHIPRDNEMQVKEAKFPVKISSGSVTRGDLIPALKVKHRNCPSATRALRQIPRTVIPIYSMGVRSSLLWYYLNSCLSQWPRGLKRTSTAARLQPSWVRIPPGHGCLSVVCCQVEISATSWSLVQRSSTDRGASLCVITILVDEGATAHAGLQCLRKNTWTIILLFIMFLEWFLITSVLYVFVYCLLL